MPASTPSGAAPVPPKPGGAVPAGAQPVVDLAIADLAKRIAASASEIAVASVTAEEWSDSSLGCPQPGMAYLQVITPGYRILLSARGKSYEYHSNRASQVVFCKES